MKPTGPEGALLEAKLVGAMGPQLSSSRAGETTLRHCCSRYARKSGDSAVATRLGKAGFHSDPEESEAAQSRLTLCDPVDERLPGFSVHGILQARILEWATILFSRGIFAT